MNEEKLKKKLETLSALCSEYSLYLENWNKSEIYFDRFARQVWVTWYREVEKVYDWGDVVKYCPFTRRVFGVEDIDERINSYKRKINYAKEKRATAHKEGTGS